MWSVWDKRTSIDGFSATYILGRFKHLRNEETIYIKTDDNGKVTQIEGKSILASVYGINPYLNDVDFIADYERILEESVESTEEA